MSRDLLNEHLASFSTLSALSPAKQRYGSFVELSKKGISGEKTYKVDSRSLRRRLEREVRRSEKVAAQPLATRKDRPC